MCSSESSTPWVPGSDVHFITILPQQRWCVTWVINIKFHYPNHIMTGYEISYYISRFIILKRSLFLVPPFSKGNKIKMIFA
jgi:hypothetical protein